RLTALPVREALAEVSSAALAVEERSQALQEPEVAIEKAKAEAIAALREDFDTIKRAWVRNEATYNVSTSGDWRWWLAEGLTVARKNRLQACVQSVGERVGFMAQQFEEMVNGVLQYISPSARSEFEAEWSEAVERGYAPEWNGVGDGPGEASGASSNGPSLGM
ncbi:hypothetical protein, partial [Gluconobacter sp. P5H9_a]|uniref:hypothetical protein n=1 Tax=Gluconobacter sp. P5H9_a TaxID=2762616 RepID=UPI001C056B7F